MDVVTGTAGRARMGLLAAAAKGDEVAFRRIIVDHHEDMRRVAAYVAGDHAIGEEATQAAWLIAWQRIGSVRDEASLRPWLVSVAANEAKRILRQQRRRASFEGAAGVRAGGVDPATGVDAMDLYAAMARLDPDDRALLAMRYIAGFDSTELARATGISPSGTRSRIERALKRLRKELEHG
jgi:DNA-directed RNA polymerase specialized sigma24 family protein